MIKIYDTRRREKVSLETIERGKIGMYVCGPTVYNRIHIGNARTFISFDIIRRYLLWRKFDVTFVQNITDVDDKIIKRAAEEGKDPADLAAEYASVFERDMRAAGVMDPDIRPRATEEIPTMIELIEELIRAGHAYEVEGDVYFSVRSYEDYGKLSGRNIDEMETGHRELRADGQGLEDRKKDSLDFALWKAAKLGEPSWDSPWGKGRPGWHIECSAMARKYLGVPFDIHGGGADLVFPHHENECAQAQAAWEKPFANYWMHGGMLQINHEKMSKSLGNFMLLHEVLEQVRPQALRMLMLQTHYRSPLDFSEERLHEADAALVRIENAVRSLDWALAHAVDGPSPVDVRGLLEAVRDARMSFIFAMDDDFNTPAALGALFKLVTEINTQVTDVTISIGDVAVLRQARAALVELMGTFGIEIDQIIQEGDVSGQVGQPKYSAELVNLAHELAQYEGNNAQDAAQALLDVRESARKNKQWDVADAVRDGLSNLGLVIEDTPQGPRLK